MRKGQLGHLTAVHSRTSWGAAGAAVEAPGPERRQGRHRGVSYRLELRGGHPARVAPDRVAALAGLEAGASFYRRCGCGKSAIGFS
jgi:hypothetical protein